MKCEKKEIMFVRGDIAEVYFEIENVELNLIEKVFFSCRELGLCFELPYCQINEGYCFRLTSEMTVLLKPTLCSYDLTIQFVDGNCCTIVKEGSFIVLKKRNEIFGGE